MRRLFVLICAGLLLAACNNKKEDQGNEDREPTAIPAPTSVVAGFDGPLLNPITNNTSEDCLLNPEGGSDCSVAVGHVEESAMPLPLTPQAVLDITLGIPADFEVLPVGDQVSIETNDSEAHPGNFRVFVQWADAEGVDKLLASYTNLDLSHKAEQTRGNLDGYTIPNAELGMVGVWQVESTRYLVLEGFVSPGYWPMYAATFQAMFDSVEIADA